MHRVLSAAHGTTVLTIELKGNTGIKKLEDFDQLQDIAGTVAIQASKVLQKSEKTERR